MVGQFVMVVLILVMMAVVAEVCSAVDGESVMVAVMVVVLVAWSRRCFSGG